MKYISRYPNLAGATFYFTDTLVTLSYFYSSLPTQHPWVTVSSCWYITMSQDRKMKVTLLLLFLSSHTTSVNALFLCSEMCITVQTSWQLSTEHASTKNNSFYFIYSQKYTKKDNQNIVNTVLCVNMMGQIKSNQNIWLNWYIQNKCQPVGTLICIMDFELSLRT